MTDNNSIPGMIYPTQKGMLAGNPRDSAIQNMNNNNQSAATAIKLLSGGRHSRRFKGGSDKPSIIVPQFQMQYEPQGGPGTNPNNQIIANSLTSTQMAANAVFDSGATKMGGSRRRTGGNPDWLWGCMSGGVNHKLKKRRTRKSTSIKKRTNRKRKTRRHHR